MKISSFARLRTHVAPLLLVAAGVSVVHAAPEVRFQLVRDALIIVPVTADDDGPFYFLLDTGADTTVVDTALAKRLTLATLRTIRQGTVTGTQTVNVSLLAEFNIGSARVERLPVLEQDLSSLRRADGRIAGIVGQNFLANFNYMLDYRARSIRFEADDDLREAIDGEAQAVEEVGSRMIVAAEAQANGSAKLRLLLDSGANSVVLMGPASAMLRCASVERAVETSSAGAAAIRTVRIGRLTVAAREFHDVTVALVDDAPVGHIADGLLPTALFERLYINNRDGFVIFNPGTKKPARLTAALR
jgi:predicted aspartyl protease